MIPLDPGSADSDFQARRAIIETLRVEATLYLDKGVKIRPFKCNFGEAVSVPGPFRFEQLAV